MGLRIAGPDGNWAQEYDEVFDRHAPLLATAVGRRLTGIWTPTRGLLSRRSAVAWASRAPVVFDFEGLLLEFEWKSLARSVTAAKTDTATMAGDPEGWYQLGEDPQAPADLGALIGQRLWAVDAFEMPIDECDLGLPCRAPVLCPECCCIVMLLCGAPQRRAVAPGIGESDPRGVSAEGGCGGAGVGDVAGVRDGCCDGADGAGITGPYGAACRAATVSSSARHQAQSRKPPATSPKPQVLSLKPHSPRRAAMPSW